jgi:DNA-binding NarL/FixJ family response regulator
MIILIIEDQESVAHLWRDFLVDKFGDRDIRVGYNMEQGIALMRETPHPDVVLLDLFLPDSTPIQTLKSIETLKAINPYAVILVITGMLDDSLPKIAAAMGADSYNDKTLMTTQSSLLDAMKHAFQKRSTDPESAPTYQKNLELLEQITSIAISQTLIHQNEATT